ncbi:MAG TPA: nucleotidyl transferase AbiEii/AbiGii toxin family protein [Gemmatimonadales bacterium]|nr:nucleotidyl transferase AbiEii/AbiGii toxin family protein [Gemmatimonadales bacterium]
MVLGGALERAGYTADGPVFTIKGGVAMELRLRHLARATRDLDLILNTGADPLEALQAALQEPYEGFSFQVKGSPLVMPNGAIRVEVGLQFLGKSWGTVQVDAAEREPAGAEVEMVDAFSLAVFGLRGPDRLPCLSLPEHVAQKIHALTLPPRPGRRNERFRDLVDLLLLRGWVTDLEAVRSACRTVFASRGTHPWPPRIEVPEHWVAPFGAMAREVGLHLHDVHSAAIEARQFLNQIEESATWYGELSNLSGLTATTWYYVIGRDGEPTRIPARNGEDLFVGHRKLDVVPYDWQRDPGGVAVVGIVLLLKDRTPAYVEGMARKAVALRGDVVGRAVELEHRSFRTIAADILRRARCSHDSANALAVFLEKIDRELPCQTARRMHVTTAQANWYRIHWRWEWFLWDIAAAQPVSGSRPG